MPAVAIMEFARTLMFVFSPQSRIPLPWLESLVSGVGMLYISFYTVIPGLTVSFKG